MKSFHAVDRNRREYHRDASVNSVHRSSLLVPELAGCRAVISFNNHFLLKRGYERVTIKVTGVGDDGRAVAARSMFVEDPRVYTVDLRAFVDTEAYVMSYVVEFFSVDNLFIPFPAVMVNHVGDDFINVVHSYNRVVNDVFEDDSVNETTVPESSVDCQIDEDVDTFVQFMSGPLSSGRVELSIEITGRDLHKSGRWSSDPARLQPCDISVREIVGEGTLAPLGTTIRVEQPKQAMFYGRLLSGIRSRSSHAFSANHSYYDSSEVREYFDSPEAARRLPYFEGCRNRVILYPICSPSELDIWVDFGASGSSSSCLLVSPGTESVLLDIDEFVEELGGHAPTSFVVRSRNRTGGSPTRVSLQARYGSPIGSPLEASINMVLHHDEVFVGRAGSYTWGQVVAAHGYESRLGIGWGDAHAESAPVEVSIFNDEGLVARESLVVAADGWCLFDTPTIAGWAATRSDPSFVWFAARSEQLGLTALAFHWDSLSGHASGEHSF